MRVNQYQYLLVAQVADSVDKAEGTSSGIDYSTEPPKNFADAMSREDAAEWMEAYRKKYQEFKDRDTVRMVIPPRGAKVLGSTTRVDNKVEKACCRNEKYVCAHEGISKSMVLMTATLRY